MKLISSKTNPDIIQELKDVKLTIETNLLELLILIGHYGEVSPYESIDNVIAILHNWGASVELIDVLSSSAKGVALDGFVDYSTSAKIVKSELAKLSLM